MGRYGLGVLLVAAAAVCRDLLVTLGFDARTTTFSPFYAAVVLTALAGGLGAGTSALLLSAATSLMFWSPADPLPPPPANSAVIFLVVGGLIVWLTHATRTARVQAERAEHRLQTVLDSITDGFVAVDFAWRYTYVNAAAQSYFGKAEAELIGRNCWDVFPQAVGTPLESYMRQVMERREPLEAELSATLAPGRWSHVRFSPTAEGISVTFRDVTEQRRLRDANLRHQERLHRSLDAARMAAWEYDTRADRLNFSPSASDVLGVPVDMLPETRADGESMIHPDDVAEHAACVRRAARSALGQYQSQYRLSDRFLCGRPGPVWIEDRGRILFDSVGQMTMIQGVLQDVTEQRATEERIRALNQDLQERIAERQALLEAAEASREAAERSSRAKDDFLAVLSHELRSPMQSVLGWVQVLRGTSLDADAARRALDTIERNLRQQAQLINDMLDVSRIVTGKLAFHLTTLPLGSVVRETVDELRPLAEAKGVGVDLSVSGDLLVVADRERVRQVVSNLFTNAVKFTPSGGFIRVSCGEHEGRARLVVQDTGSGIPYEMQARIFERFRQADTSSTRHHEGLGLGLSITKYIVDHLGGTIVVASEGHGTGASFTVALPLVAPRERATAALGTDRGADGAQAGMRRLDRLDLLVVDDHPDTVELIAFVLRRQGALVRTATSAQEALAAWQMHPAQVLVTDLSMPGMDGYALLEAIGGGTGSRVQAVALSGLARAADRERALAAGFAAHLAKPIEPDVLIATLERLLPSLAAREAGRPSLA